LRLCERGGHVLRRAPLSSHLPTPLLFAGVIALLPLAALVRQPTSPRSRDRHPRPPLLVGR
jgi:hypothetical protein